MAFKFKSVFRKKPGTQEGKYYASVSSYAKITEKQLAEEIGSLTALNRTDVHSVLDALLQVIPQNLAKGLRVELGDLGSFTISAKSEGKEKAEDVTAHCIQTPKPRFMAGKALKEAVRGISFEKE
jgi:predicted histone-like DNA-binding protein